MDKDITISMQRSLDRYLYQITKFAKNNPGKIAVGDHNLYVGVYEFWISNSYYAFSLSRDKIKILGFSNEAIDKLLLACADKIRERNPYGIRQFTPFKLDPIEEASDL